MNFINLILRDSGSVIRDLVIRDWLSAIGYPRLVIRDWLSAIGYPRFFSIIRDCLSAILKIRELFSIIRDC